MNRKTSAAQIGRVLTSAILIFCAELLAAQAQTTAFTYQGKLNDGAMAASGTYDLGFALYDAETGGNLIGSAITRPNVTVSGGVFTVQLDFGAAAFTTGASRFLQVAVKKTSETNFTTLTPRQPITSTPYAIQSLNATNATNAVNATNATNATNAANATQLGGVAANNFVQTDSTAFVRNQTTQQASTDFNVSGTGAANIFNAATQFNIGDSRVLSNAGTKNLFVGVGAGSTNTGIGNAFFGFNAGVGNTAGRGNAFFGSEVGSRNTTGNGNSFFGSTSGFSNTTGGGNVFFGSGAGGSNTVGTANTFVGSGSGRSNTTGFTNAFVGGSAGVSNTTGDDNTFFGYYAGIDNTTGSNNTLLGSYAEVGANNLTYATAVGSKAIVSTSNTVVLGRAADTVQIPGSLNVSGNVSSGCRTGFTAAANGRLCISATQPANTFYAAAQVCTNLGARLGDSADVALSFTLSDFNYFAGSTGNEPIPKGWLADIINDGVRATWNANSPTADFDGTPLNVNTGGTGGTAPQLLYRCVY